MQTQERQLVPNVKRSQSLDLLSAEVALAIPNDDIRLRPILGISESRFSRFLLRCKHDLDHFFLLRLADDNSRRRGSLGSVAFPPQ